MKKLFTNIYNFFASPAFLFFFVRTLNVVLFLMLVMVAGPWWWVNKIDPAITINSSYMEFVCASILCWWVIQNIGPRQKTKEQTIDVWLDDD
jgi:hypothetical protein